MSSERQKRWNKKSRAIIKSDPVRYAEYKHLARLYQKSRREHEKRLRAGVSVKQMVAEEREKIKERVSDMIHFPEISDEMLETRLERFFKRKGWE